MKIITFLYLVKIENSIELINLNMCYDKKFIILFLTISQD